MRIPVEDGHGKLVGAVEIEDGTLKPDHDELTVSWQYRRHFTTNTFTVLTGQLTMKIVRDNPRRPVIVAKWKARERLKRGRLLLPVTKADVDAKFGTAKQPENP